MSPERIPYLLVGFFSVFVASVSQTLLKAESVREHSSFLREYLNLRVILAYALLGLSMLLTWYAYKGLPLSMTPAFESSSYLFVTFFGAVFFHEKVTPRRLLALALIVAGILVFTL